MTFKTKIELTTIISTAICILLVYIVFAFMFQFTVISSASMEPTLMTGEYAVYNHMAYIIGSVERGDIIEYYSREYDMIFSKRVIGIAGDHIEFHDGNVFINGMQCVEPYISDEIKTYCVKTFDVPEGTVFVMGDNRWNSIDSREFENPYISLEDIQGKFFGLLRNPFH